MARFLMSEWFINCDDNCSFGVTSLASLSDVSSLLSGITFDRRLIQTLSETIGAWPERARKKCLFEQVFSLKNSYKLVSLLSQILPKEGGGKLNFWWDMCWNPGKHKTSQVTKENRNPCSSCVTFVRLEGRFSEKKGKEVKYSYLCNHFLLKYVWPLPWLK